MKKKVKLLMATNLYQIDPIVYSSHLDMFYKLGKKHEDFELMFYAPWRVPIDKARNDAAFLAATANCDYLFFYDDDMWFPDGNTPIDMVQKMIDNPKIHMLQALAYIRGYPYKPMAFKFLDKGSNRSKRLMTHDNFAEHIDEDGLVECDALGCCATVINAEIFRALPKPWFLTGEQHTEDVYFCIKAKTQVKDFGIYLDTKIKIGHLLDRVVLVDENRTMLKEMHEKYGINQLFLSEPTFVQKMSQTPHMMWDERKCLNPLEANIPFREESKDGNI